MLLLLIGSITYLGTETGNYRLASALLRTPGNTPGQAPANRSTSRAARQPHADLFRSAFT